MRHPVDHHPAETDTADVVLSAPEREVLALLMQGLSLRTVSRRLGISDAAVNARLRVLLHKFGVSTADELIAQVASSSALSDSGASRLSGTEIQRQSRWLPDLSLSATGPLGEVCRHTFNCRTLRDVADVLREFDDLPNPSPDDPTALLTHRTGTLGARQALLAALAAESGCDDVQLILACYELLLPRTAASASPPGTLPLVVCYLHCRARDVQISKAGAGSIIQGNPLSTTRVEPMTMCAERIRLYKSFAAEWCEALEVTPGAFASLRADQLLNAQRHSVVEDLLGYQLPPDFAPMAR